MKLHRVLDSVLILLLLFAQQAAYAHAISHVGREPPPKEQLAHSKVCDKCTSFEKIAGIAPAAAVLAGGLDLHFVQQAQGAYPFRPLLFAVFHSRAPPLFL